MICRRAVGMGWKARIGRSMSWVEGKQKWLGEQLKPSFVWRCKQQGLSMMFRSAFYFCVHSNESKTDIIPLHGMQDAIRKDIKNNYHSYTLIRQSLITHIAQEQYSKNNETELINILTLLTQYPIFPLPKTTILLIYKIICFNLHLKSVESLNNMLLFVLIADQQPSESPIFHQFIRFYLQLTIQQFKFKYQLDFTSMSPLQAIKQFIGKLVHRGFLPRTPPYQRNLNILHHQKTLDLLAKSESVKSSQMIKKINYSVFLDIKQFYETQMKENLYHPKKKHLLQKFNNDYLQFLSEQVDMTHHQAIHLRELYMKLYLTLPEEGELDVFKYKHTIFMYWLGMRHIQRLDHLKLQQIKEKIDVVIQYVQQVAYNMKRLLKFQEEELEGLGLSLEELLLIVKCLLQTDNTTESCGKLLNLIHNKTSPIIFYHYFSLYNDLFKQSSNHQSITQIISNYKNYQWLKLPQLLELLSCFEPPRMSQRSIILTNILTKIIQTDFQVIGGQQIIIFLNIYKALVDLNLNNDSQTNSAQQFRKFQMRYIADHHQQFSIKEFQEIVVLLAKLPKNQCAAFDDADNNYPNTIFQQIKPYFTKVSLLLSQQTKEAFQAAEMQKSPSD